MYFSSLTFMPHVSPVPVMWRRSIFELALMQHTFTKCQPPQKGWSL
jgi:hypothetical protein